jgi:ribosomal protein L7/L12
VAGEEIKESLNDDSSLEVSFYEMELARSGQKIPAIKNYRQRTGVGLKQAKDTIDAFLEGK